MQKKIKISLITVCYNSEKTIKDTFESVLKQKYDNYEYLVIDGASKDSTVKIIKEYEKKFKGKMKWISEKDKGIYDAMNKGVKMASGDVIGLINSDDYLYSADVFSIISDNFDDNVDGVYGNLFLEADDALGIPKRTIISKKGKYSLGWMPPHPTVYLRKEVYKKVGLYDIKFRIAADYDLLLRIYKEHIDLKYINEILVCMRPGGASTDGIKGQIEGAKDAYRVIKKNKLKFPLFVSLCKVFRGASRAFLSKIKKDN